VHTLRGQNGGKDYPQDLLIEIYNDIKENEIRIPEEHLHEEINQMTWQYLMKKYNNIKGMFSPYLSTQQSKRVSNISSLIFLLA
jgi:Sec7-like guanine-nucleotide exchange factor